MARSTAMAGETVKTRAICLAIRPWSRTSHVVIWLTPTGCVTTVVRGAVRPKSAFLGQYDFNYTCEILYYARAKGEAHALRECAPCNRRDALRGNFRMLALADWFRRLALDLTPTGPDAAAWFELLEKSLDRLESLESLAVWEFGGSAVNQPPNHQTTKQPNSQTTKLPNNQTTKLPNNQTTKLPNYLQRLLEYELAVLRLSGLAPEFGDSDGVCHLRGERNIPVSAEVISCLENPALEKNLKILVDAARVIGVFYTFHVDCAPDVRRTVLRIISR